MHRRPSSTASTKIALATIVAAAAAADLSLVVVGAQQPQIVRKDRSYYAYGYEGDTTEGLPNGYVRQIIDKQHTSVFNAVC